MELVQAGVVTIAGELNLELHLVSFHWDLSYAAAELGPWLLLLVGIAFLIPVAVSSGLDPESRLYPRGRHAYFVWGVALYLLGALLAAQLFEVWGYKA